jgi:putative transferase (TIGR04331 family)
MSSNFFLATTAIEEFWDKNQKIIFLGEWCKLYNRKNEWMSLEYEDVPFVWKNTEIVLNGIEYCNKIYEKSLVQLTQTLNAYHCIEKDVRYYRIILGNWLFLFIHQLYDKYLTLKKAFGKYPNAQTWLLDEEQYYIPVEYNSYIEHILSDKYALQIYSQVLMALGYDFERKKLSKPIEQSLSYRLNFDLSKKLRLFNLFTKVSLPILALLHKKTITITAPYSNYNFVEAYLKLLFKSRFRCIFDDMRYKVDISFNIDQTMRKQELSLNGDEFESVFSKILLSNIPVLFMEGFASFRDSVIKMPIHNSKAFFTANALHGNYIFKFFLAEHYKTIKILNGQHGGGYGIHFTTAIEEYEKSVADIFYTAGWKKNESTIPLAVPKFFSKEHSTAISTDKTLFTIIEMPRYVYRLQFSPLASNYLFETINQIMIFLKHFQKRDKLVIRTYPQDLYGWDTNKRIAEHFSDCFFDDFSKPFDQMLRTAKIFLTSGAHTTYLEALAANKPTVIFLSDKVFRFHPDAQPYFERLQDANILHYSPESAAEHLNVVYDDVDTWWQSDKVQETRIAFVNQYARCSSNWAEEWVAEFDRVLAEC